MCAFALSDDAIKVRHVVERSAIGLAPPEPPPMLARVVAFAGAVAHHVATGMVAASDEVKAARLAICRTNECGMYRGDSDGVACLACGCGARGLATKAGWAEISCPLDPPRWGSVKAEPEPI